MEDTILEQELIRNERIIEHSNLGSLRLRRPTPAMEASISEQRRRVYHKDLKDDSILTKDEVALILQRRGIWTPEHDTKMQSLTVRSGDLMVKLTALGYDPKSNLYSSIMEVRDTLYTTVQESDTEIDDSLERIFNDADIPSYTDIRILNESIEEQDEVIQNLNTLVIQMEILTDFAEVKKELQDLLVTYTKFFGDTIEERANRAERMAHIFFCVTKVDDGNRLWESFEAMWDDDPEEIAWVHSQLFNFQNGITEEYAEVLQTYGFMERVSDIKDSLEDSQDPPQPKSDGESQESSSPDSSDTDIVTS